MRVLLTNNHLGDMGGTETWVYTMAQYLRQFFDVGVFTNHKGYVANLLEDLIDDYPQGYDIALINHNSCVSVNAKYKIFTSHGIVPNLEKPPVGCDEYVAVNEKVAEYHNIKKIIKNPIDTERFKPESEIRNKPERILSISNAGIPLKTCKPSRKANNMPRMINDHDLVISMGRGALEAMSCGRNVISWDVKAGWEARGDGYIDLSNMEGYTAGPYAKTSIDWGEELAKYTKQQGKKNRDYILKHHDVKKIAKEYLGGHLPAKI